MVNAGLITYYYCISSISTVGNTFSSRSPTFKTVLMLVNSHRSVFESQYPIYF